MSSQSVFLRVELRRLFERTWRILRVSVVAGVVFCGLVGVATCVKFHPPYKGETPTTRVPPMVVTRPAGDVRGDMQPLLASDSAYFRQYPLMVPVEGISPSSLTDTFHEARSGGRIHMATDILAMRGTPVLAAAPGRIVRLANGGAGGITIYVADASGRYMEYYAHLMGYAPNVKEGLQVEQGTVIGFVGTTGNAPPNTPHLHFQVMRSDANYWNGTPIDVRVFMTKPGRMKN
jgi:murein DD-endopeptidase MepM/ murein hydrolase activator NlpD